MRIYRMSFDVLILNILLILSEIFIIFREMRVTVPK